MIEWIVGIHLIESNCKYRSLEFSSGEQNENLRVTSRKVLRTTNKLERAVVMGFEES